MDTSFIDSLRRELAKRAAPKVIMHDESLSDAIHASITYKLNTPKKPEMKIFRFHLTPATNVLRRVRTQKQRTVTVVYKTDFDMLRFGFSVNHPKEQFVKKIGVKVATDRLNSGVFGVSAAQLIKLFTDVTSAYVTNPQTWVENQINSWSGQRSNLCNAKSLFPKATMQVYKDMKILEHCIHLIKTYGVQSLSHSIVEQILTVVMHEKLHELLSLPKNPYNDEAVIRMLGGCALPHNYYGVSEPEKDK